MSNHDAFLRAILDEPDDDAPRLVYADWLEEHGDADRAEFIRVQIELARLPEEDRRVPALRKREAALLKQHKGKWLHRLDGFISEGEFLRGFVESVSITGGAFLENAAALFAAIPVRRLRLLAPNVFEHPEFREEPVYLLARLPQTAALTHLDVRHHYLESSHIEDLVRNPYLKHLRSLDLTGNYIEQGAIRPLVESPVLGQLEELALGDDDCVDMECFTDSTLDVLTDSPRLGQLTVLRVKSYDLSSAALLRLVESPFATCLHTLELVAWGFSDAVTPALVATPARAARWRGLAFPGNFLDNTQIQPLADSPNLTRLETLDLRNNDINLVGVKALVRSPALQALQRLELADNPIPPTGKALLKKRFGARVCRFT